jgi:hypothetical protein
MGIRLRIERTCKVCGKKFHPSRIEYETCSHICGNLSRKGKTAYNKEKVLCKTCGNELWRNKWDREHKKNHFCNSVCYGVWKRDTMKGNGNNNYRGSTHSRVCKTCGKEFITRRHKQKYCSNKCCKRVNLKARGTGIERKAKQELIEQGYYVVRSAGSLGLFDLIAFNDKEIIFIQIKATKTARENIMLKEDERKRLNEFKSIPPNSRIELWCWESYKGWKKERIGDING